MTQLEANLALLEARGLLRVATDQSKPVVRFKHALTREATYNSILQTRRSVLHCAVAQTLQHSTAPLELELVISIAEHLAECGDDAGLLAFLLPFAQNLIYTGRSTTLSDLLARLDRAALNETQQRDADLTLADAHAARGEYEPARKLYERALPFAETAAVRARMLYSLGVSYDHLGNFAQAIASHQACLVLAGETGDVAFQARATGGMGSAYRNLGDLAAAEKYFVQSRDLSSGLGASQELANAEYNLSILHADRGEYQTAIGLAEHALALDEKFGHLSHIARTYQLLGALHHYQGALTQAEALYCRAIESSRALNDVQGTANGLVNLAELYTQRDDPLGALELFAQAIALFRQIENDTALAYGLAKLGEAHYCLALTSAEQTARAHHLAAAHEKAYQALELAQTLGAREREGMAARVLASVLALEGEFAQARSYADRAILLLEQSGTSQELDLARTAQRAILDLSPGPVQV